MLVTDKRSSVDRSVSIRPEFETSFTGVSKVDNEEEEEEEEGGSRIELVRASDEDVLFEVPVTAFGTGTLVEANALNRC